MLFLCLKQTRNGESLHFVSFFSSKRVQTQETRGAKPLFRGNFVSEEANRVLLPFEKRLFPLRFFGNNKETLTPPEGCLDGETIPLEKV